jgi:Raf kinase inhibitor-like YbhB/YbcL family protein
VNLERTRPPGPFETLPPVPSFELASADIFDGAVTAVRHVHGSAGGENLSPHLAWSGFPDDTGSFAITVFDPDAPTQSGWWHWQVVNIPASVTSLERGATMPEGTIEFRTDYGVPGYQGASPPPGDHEHRYYFAVHALDVERLDLDPDTPAAVVGFTITAHTIARAVLVVTFAVQT